MVTVRYTNDLSGGSATKDRNLYVNSLTLNGVDQFKAAALMTNGDANFAIGTAPPPPAYAASAGSGSDQILLSVSQDAYKGDAQFQVFVDNRQVGGTFTAQASNSLGKSDIFELRGEFATGNHAVRVKFTNDLWDGTPQTDRNLYIDRAVINGTDVQIDTEIKGVGDFNIFF
jgi:hypothetical protein